MNNSKPGNKLDPRLKAIKVEPSLLSKKFILTHLLHMAQEFNRWSIETLNQCRLIAKDIESEENKLNVESSLRWTNRKKPGKSSTRH